MGARQSNRSKHTHDASDHDDLARVYQAVEDLKSFKNYGTEKTQEALQEIEMMADGLQDDMKASVVKKLLDKGFAQLFLRIFQSLQPSKAPAAKRKSQRETNRRRKENFKLITDICLEFSDIYEEDTNIGLEFMQNGSINAILEELNSQVTGATTTKEQSSTIATMLMILDNCAACGADALVRCTYRKANAVEILQKYLQSDEILFKIVSLFILSRITGEEESDKLAATEGCLSSLVQLTRDAIHAEDNVVFFDSFGEENIGYGLWRLINAIHRLATNTANQQKLVQHQVVPVIVEILSPSYMDDPGFPQVVLETLWKLAFVDSHKDIIISQLKDDVNVLPCKFSALNIDISNRVKYHESFDIQSVPRTFRVL